MSEAPTTEQVYSQYQAVVEQLQILENQLSALDSAIRDLMISLDTIDGLSLNSAEEEIIIPIGGLISLRGRLTGKKELLVNLGSGIITPLSLDDAKKHIQTRLDETNSVKVKLAEDHKKLSEIAQNLQHILNQPRD